MDINLTTVLTSGVVAGLVAGLVTLRTSERKIAIENITQQRQLWREKVRKKALEITKAHNGTERTIIKELYVELQLILNPEDQEDHSILDTVWNMQTKDSSKDLSIELSEKLSLLLKHDWERAKREAKPVFYRWLKPKRITYDNFKYKRDTIKANKDNQHGSK